MRDFQALPYKNGMDDSKQLNMINIIKRVIRVIFLGCNPNLAY